MKKGNCLDRILLITVSLLLFTATYSQNLTGYWQGVFNNDQRNGRRDPYFLNMVLYQDGRTIEGRFSNSLMESPNQPQVVFEISGITGKKDKIPVSLRVGRILYNTLLPGVAEYFLQFDDIHYIKNDTMEVLYGVWMPNGTGRASDGRAGTFWVRKIQQHDSPKKIPFITENTFKDQLPPVKSDSLQLAEQVVKRQNIEQGDIVVNTKKISLQLYDNGIVDDDSVSIFFNGKLLLSHQRITETPIVLDIELDVNNPKNELILFAENLGIISPNTALIIVIAGNKRFELFSKTNLKENAVLLFRYQPE